MTYCTQDMARYSIAPKRNGQSLSQEQKVMMEKQGAFRKSEKYRSAVWNKWRKKNKKKKKVKTHD